MSTLLTINVTNHISATQTFYFFQHPSMYTGGSRVYSNSLYSQALGNYASTGSVLTFQVSLQPYAGIQQAHQQPQVGQSSGFASAYRAIELAPASGTANDCTTASVSPLGLSPATVGPNVEPGAFRIIMPTYQPPVLYNIGSAVQANGSLLLSNFVVANPASTTDCQPILRYYVQTGSYMAGSVINFTTSSVTAALCDFTGGYSTMNVSLNPDGTWTVQAIR
ncbi:hypothetical protein [Ancylobacter polymorphus]|uniref:Uncharacterized protein n=1 Tax=Ancylobacter polymorphus TaxID=223390 RepID=A0A9E6ZVD3_9HYPH|nr:hypothetical protein [Ancylobacter polymorphus]UOK70727.1 hypothetical protein K9D25_18710 [Ancylobacter polymorphus]